MEYQSISPPLAFNNPRLASSKEAKEFFEWFVSVKDERVKILEKAVQTTPGFEDWKANFTPVSLAKLSDWLKKVAEIRPFTPEEIEEEKAKIKNPFKGIIKVATSTLRGKTVSIAFDAGIYMGEVLRRNNKGLEWKLHRGKTFDFNQPVLTGFGKTSFNHRLILQNQVGKLLNKKPVDLIKLYNVWVSFIPTESIH